MRVATRSWPLHSPRFQRICSNAVALHAPAGGIGSKVEARGDGSKRGRVLHAGVLVHAPGDGGAIARVRQPRGGGEFAAPAGLIPSVGLQPSALRQPCMRRGDGLGEALARGDAGEVGLAEREPAEREVQVRVDEGGADPRTAVEVAVEGAAIELLDATILDDEAARGRPGRIGCPDALGAHAKAGHGSGIVGACASDSVRSSRVRAWSPRAGLRRRRPSSPRRFHSRVRWRVRGRVWAVHRAGRGWAVPGPLRLHRHRRRQA